MKLLWNFLNYTDKLLHKGVKPTNKPSLEIRAKKKAKRKATKKARKK